MLTTRDRLTGNKLPDDNIRDQLLTLLIAGHETTSGALSYTLYYIARHPEVERQLIAEVDRVLGRDYGYVPTFEDIERLEYTGRVLKESLRLRPTAPAFARKVARDTVVAGKYPVRAEGVILVPLMELHTNPRVWNEPQRFDPDRWLPDAVAAHHPHAYHPFGAGMRSCIGFQFALIEAKLVLAKLYQRYLPRTSDPDYVLQDLQTLTIKPDKLYMRFERRREEKGVGPVRASVARADREAPEAAASSGTPLTILYGSNMGASQLLAEQIAEQAKNNGYSPTLAELDRGVGRLAPDAPVVIVTSTYNGQPPDNAASFSRWLASLDAGARPFANVGYCVFGFGNSNWRTSFHKFPRFVDDRLAALGAERLLPLAGADADGDSDAAVESWCDAIWPALQRRVGDTSEEAPPPMSMRAFAPSYAVELVNYAGAEKNALLPCCYPVHEDARRAHVLRIAELQSPTSERSTVHVEVTLPEGVSYAAGDHLAVFPENNDEVIAKVASRCGLRGEDVVLLSARGAAASSAAYPLGVPVTVRDLLAHTDLIGPLSRRELRVLAERTPCPPERAALERLASEAHYKSEVLDSRLTLLELFERHPSTPYDLALLLSLRPVLRPRYYSISSSPRLMPTSCSITAGGHSFVSKSGRSYDGVASSYLARLQPGSWLRLLVKDTGSAFRLPDDPKVGLLLVAAGTGLSPFRGFLQERAALQRSGVELGECILYFGCRHSEQDFIYRDELEAYLESKVLTGLHVAFSREADRPKQYVQHKLSANGKDTCRLLDEGGVVYVCGDARRMAPDVAQAFIAILREHGGASESQAAQRFDVLRNEGRYREDVWASA
jgi:cytochrome P450/NADPH-cytochrome P450 reductase